MTHEGTEDIGGREDPYGAMVYIQNGEGADILPQHDAAQAELRTKKNEIRLVVDVGPLGGVEWLTGAEPLSQAGHRV